MQPVHRAKGLASAHSGEWHAAIRAPAHQPCSPPFREQAERPAPGRGQRSLYSSLGSLSIHVGHPRSVPEELLEVRRRSESGTGLGTRPSAPALRASCEDVSIHAPWSALVRTGGI